MTSCKPGESVRVAREFLHFAMQSLHSIHLHTEPFGRRLSDSITICLPRGVNESLGIWTIPCNLGIFSAIAQLQSGSALISSNSYTACWQAAMNSVFTFKTSFQALSTATFDGVSLTESCLLSSVASWTDLHSGLGIHLQPRFHVTSVSARSRTRHGFVSAAARLARRIIGLCHSTPARCFPTTPLSQLRAKPDC